MNIEFDCGSSNSININQIRFFNVVGEIGGLPFLVVFGWQKPFKWCLLGRGQVPFQVVFAWQKPTTISSGVCPAEAKHHFKWFLPGRRNHFLTFLIISKARVPSACMFQLHFSHSLKYPFASQPISASELMWFFSH
jgi:hypothetical protein